MRIWSFPLCIEKEWTLFTSGANTVARLAKLSSDPILLSQDTPVHLHDSCYSWPTWRDSLMRWHDLLLLHADTPLMFHKAQCFCSPLIPALLVRSFLGTGFRTTAMLMTLNSVTPSFPLSLYLYLWYAAHHGWQLISRTLFPANLICRTVHIQWSERNPNVKILWSLGTTPRSHHLLLSAALG